MPSTPPLRERGILLLVVALVLLLVPVGYSLVSSLLAGEPENVRTFLERPAPEHEQCVRETAYMRYHHWELLRAAREEVVRYGVRDEVGLRRCMDCHKSRERFCDRCHEAVSLHPDCFGCHHYP